MAIEAIKGAGMVYQGSTSTAQIKEQAQGRTEVSSADNQVVSDSIARNIQAMNTKEASGDSAVDAGAQGQAQAGQLDKGNAQLKKAVDDINIRIMMISACFAASAATYTLNPCSSALFHDLLPS